MDMKDLQTYTIILVVVGLMVGVGVLVLDKFSQSAYEDTTATNLTQVLQNSTNTTFTNTPLVSFSELRYANHSVVPASKYSVFTDDNKIILVTINNGTFEMDYVWENQNTATSTALDSSRDAVSSIATDWLSLVVTIFILAIILGFVINSFVGKAR